jgi:hypothetical protein
MKSFIAGLLTIIALGIAGFYTFKATTNFMSRLNPMPSANPSIVPSISPTPSVTPKPSITPEPSYLPTTKGGLPIKTGVVKGVSTLKAVSAVKKITTTTTTTTHLTLTLVKTSTCPISYQTEIKDIQGPLTLRYQLIDNTSFGITIWNSKGEELLQNTTYSGNSGTIKTISGVDYMKVRVESKSCASNNDNWLTLTAER